MSKAKIKGLGIGEIIIVCVLAAILLATCIWVASAWTLAADVSIGKHGWIALGLGTFFSLVIGCGLMALMFFSSRRGYDEAADPFRRKRDRPADRIDDRH
jgi:hypothetical protein